jgi:hypothetical protein
MGLLNRLLAPTARQKTEVTHETEIGYASDAGVVCEFAMAVQFEADTVAGTVVAPAGAPPPPICTSPRSGSASAHPIVRIRPMARPV